VIDRYYNSTIAFRRRRGSIGRTLNAVSHFGAKQSTRCGGPAWRKTCKLNSFCVGMVWQTQSIVHLAQTKKTSANLNQLKPVYCDMTKRAPISDVHLLKKSKAIQLQGRREKFRARGQKLLTAPKFLSSIYCNITIASQCSQTCL